MGQDWVTEYAHMQTKAAGYVVLPIKGKEETYLKTKNLPPNMSSALW